MERNSAPTMSVSKVICQKMRDDLCAGEETPWTHIAETKRKLHPEQDILSWDEDDKEAAVMSLALWISVQVVGMAKTVEGEVREAADALKGQKVGDDVAASMGFLSNVLKTWVQEVDANAIAEQVFDTCVEFERERDNPDPQVSREAAKKEKASQLLDELLAKCKPSDN